MTVQEKNEATTTTTFVISGAGIVGLTLALSLHKHTGVTPVVYEKRGADDFHACVGAGMGMYPNGLRVLRDISPDMLEQVRALGKPYLTRRWVKHCETEIAKSDEQVLHQGDKDDVQSLGIGRWRLHKLLWETCQTMGIPVHFHKATHKIEQLDQDSSSLVRVTFDDGTHCLTQLLFGTDGTHSKTRELVVDKKQHELNYVGVTCVMGIAQDCPKPDAGVCCPSSMTSQCHALFFPTQEHEQCFQIYFPIAETDADTDTWGKLSEQVDKEDCHALSESLRADGWDEKYCQPLEHVTRAVRVGFCEIQPPLAHWAYGRVVLLGDAAHPPVPYTGQGAQMGLEDAATMAVLFKQYCLDSNGFINWEGLPQALSQLEALRIPRVAEIAKASHQMGAMQQKQAECRRYARKQAMQLQREVFFHQTSPLLIPGAQYNFEAEIQKVVLSSK